MMANTGALPRQPAAGGIATLIETSARLAELLAQETALVRAMRIREIAPLQAEKARLTRLVQQTLKTLDPKAGIPSPLRPHWLSVGKRLAEAATENERALRVGQTAADRLIATIVAGVRESRSAVSGYTARRAAPRRPVSAGVVNRQL
jgi:hypothetical protein